MKVYITFTDVSRGMSDVHLDELAQALHDADINCTIEHGAPVAGEKGDVATALVLVGLAMQGVGALVSVLTFWRSTRPNYSVTIRCGNETYAITNLDTEAATQKISGLVATSPETLSIEVSRDKQP